jgi:uncharacterized protein YndB with AHSA1/START domain
MPSNSAGHGATAEVLEIVRTFEAPRPLLFRLWADPAHRVRWWGPEGYGLSHCEVDFRVGGGWSVAMQRVDGYEHWVRGVFTEIVEPNRLCFTYVNDDDPHEMLVEMDFVEQGPRTEMRFRQAPFHSRKERDEHGWGWNSTLELLSAYARRVNAADPKPVGPSRLESAADIVAARAKLKNSKQGE